MQEYKLEVTKVVSFVKRADNLPIVSVSSNRTYLINSHQNMV